MGDFNKDVKSSNSDKDKLENFCNLFNFKNLVHTETCFLKNIKTLIDLILTNKPLYFKKKKKKKKKKRENKKKTTNQKKHLLLTGLSNYHILISTFSNNRVSNNREVIRHLS